MRSLFLLAAIILASCAHPELMDRAKFAVLQAQYAAALDSCVTNSASYREYEACARAADTKFGRTP
jgi:hypothetical protein